MRSAIVLTTVMLAVFALISGDASRASAEEKVLFDFESADAAASWAPAKLPEVKDEAPAPKVELTAEGATSGKQALRLVFGGGAWPVVATAKIPVGGNWKEFRTLKADLTADRPVVAYFRICQGQPDENGRQSYHERTMILEKGANEMTLVIRGGIGAMDPAKGDITSFIIGAFRPENGQTLVVDNVRLSPDWPPPRVVGWYSPYNHDGYSSAVAREYGRTGQVTKLKVLGTDMEVADLPDLAKRLRDQWVQPEPKTIEQVEAEFRARYDELKKTHPKAVLASLRDGEKGWNPANPDEVYAGWKMVYISCHGPDGPNPGRENTPHLYDTVEAFMRHRSPLMQADLSGIPKDSVILAAKLVITRAGAPGPKTGERTSFKPNMWAAEPCSRPWDEKSANCYFYATGRHWKAVSGLYYGQDPDYRPVFIAHGPAGTGATNVWDFTEALRFWTSGGHTNHGFFLYGDSVDYMRICTQTARDVKLRPAIMVVYEPKQ